MKNRSPRRKIFILIWRYCSASPCLRQASAASSRVEPLQGVPRLHGVVQGSGGRPDGGHAAPVRGVRSAGAAGKSVVEFDRRGKAAKATLALVGTVREAAGFPKE